MRKINLLCAFLTACCMTLCLAAAKNDSDPEVLSSKGGKRNYTGVYPVKTIAIITPGSYPNPKTANPAIKLLRKAGYKTGLYMSPYVYDFRERVQLNGQLPDGQLLADALESMIPALDEMKAEGRECTEFETLTCMGLSCRS